MDIKLPKQVLFILQTLEMNNEEVYVVGGCVRDALMNQKPHDWDITTSAEPERVINIFNELGFGVLPTGIEHGTVTLMLDNESFEITTYRTESDYEDHRHPKRVSFTKNILQDLERRDFTMNAIAYHPVKGFLDPFGGQEDIENKIIRAVGDPTQRFEEDALRILRMVRFASTLDFQIDFETFKAAEDKKDNLRFISNERVAAELEKTVCGKYFSRVYFVFPKFFSFIFPFDSMFGFDQKNPWYDYTLWQHTINVVMNCNYKDPILRMAALFHDVGKLVTFTETFENGKIHRHYYRHAKASAFTVEAVLKQLKFSNSFVEDVTNLIYYHDVTFSPTKKFIRHMLTQMSEENFARLIQLRQADIFGQRINVKPNDNRLIRLQQTKIIFENFDTETECINRSKLSVGGNDLMQLGFKPGPLMGQILNEMLANVINEKLENSKEALLDYAKERGGFQ